MSSRACDPLVAMKPEDCPVRATVGVIGGKWKPLILFYLKDRTMRFNELRRPVSGESLHRAACRRFWYPWPQAGVWAVFVVMSHPLLENSPQMLLIQRNQEIQTLLANGSD